MRTVLRMEGLFRVRHRWEMAGLGAGLSLSGTAKWGSEVVLRMKTMACRVLRWEPGEVATMSTTPTGATAGELMLISQTAEGRLLVINTVDALVSMSPALSAR